MICTAEMKSPAPRANAEIRAVVTHNDNILSIVTLEPEDNFAARFLSRRYGVALPMARTIAALALLGGSVR